MTVGLVGRMAGRRLDGGADIEDAYAAPSPWLSVNFVVGLDGAVELDGVSGGLGGPADREIFAAMRSLADVVMVGASTARSEDYGPAWLGEGRRRRRAERGQEPLPAMAVVTASASLDPTARLFKERRRDQPEPPRVIVLTAGSAPPARRGRLEEVADVVVCGDDRVDLVAAVEHLRRAGLARIGCEGGPCLLGGLLERGLVDELCCTHAPLIGGAGRLTLSGGGDGRATPTGFELTDLLVEGSVLFGRYRVAGGRGSGGPR